jgi:hypothetical protein
MERWQCGILRRRFLPRLTRGIAVALGILANALAQSNSTKPEDRGRAGIGLGTSQIEQFPAPVPGIQPIGGIQSTPSGADTDTATADRKGEIIFAPIPISSQAIGVGVVPGLAYVFHPSKLDRVSPPSTLALAGAYTSTKTYGGGVGGLLNLKEDRYRIAFLVGAARARYEFFGIGSGAGTAGNSVWLSQHGHAVLLQGMRQIKWKIFVGPRYSHRQIRAAHETTLSDLFPNLPVPPDLDNQFDLSITSAALGFRVERDTRNDTFYPQKGSRIDGRIDFFGPYVGSTFTFQSYQFEMNKYLPYRQRHVIALRAMGCGVTGDKIPFFELCQFGWMGDLRGYQTGRYRDRAMFATQGEWRIVLPMRLGAALFGGVGEVAPDGGSFSTKNLLPSGGAGLRFNLSKQRRIHLRLDLAYSKTGGSWSMGVAEAF